jgi:hypothetical protein
MKCDNCGREFADIEVYNMHDCRDVDAMEDRIEILEDIISRIFSHIVFAKNILYEDWAIFPSLEDIKDEPAVQEILQKREVPK